MTQRRPPFTGRFSPRRLGDGLLIGAALGCVAGGPAWPQSQPQGGTALNPLASISREDLTGFRERPLFSSTRRRPDAAVEPELEVVEEPGVAGLEETPVPNVRLVGVIRVAGANIAVIENLDAATTESLRAGGEVGGWEIASVGTASAMLKNGDQEHELKMFVPGAYPVAPQGGEAEFDPAGEQSLEYQGEVAPPDGGPQMPQD